MPIKDTEERRKYHREYMREYYRKHPEKANNYKPDEYYSVYYLPEEHYVGMTNYLKRRIWNHNAKGRIVEGHEVIATFERDIDAHWFETLLHMRGYNGYHHKN